jgi:hypothetical protein
MILIRLIFDSQRFLVGDPERILCKTWQEAAEDWWRNPPHLNGEPRKHYPKMEKFPPGLSDNSRAKSAGTTKMIYQGRFIIAIM